MPSPVTCPSAHEYERLRRGELSLPEVEQLAQHIEKCGRCADQMQSLPVDDTLIEALRARSTVTDPKEQDRVSDLVARLKQFRLPVNSAVEATTAESPVASALAPAEQTCELYDFLAPPQGAGEIGRLGSYRVLKVLGTGGMGVVFQAEDVKLKRLVALKAMRPAMAASAGAGQRFQREAETTAAIKHDHIVTIYQVGEDRGVPFLAMEFLEGEALDDRLKRENTLPISEALRISREIAEGLAAAHEHGLIHRDIKPGNVWLEGKRGRVKILDFGLARATGDDMHLTQSGAIVGTPAYMAPEQARGEALDHHCDLFSLGCVLYRMVTGVLPFHGKDTMSMLQALATQHPRSPRELNPQLPLALNNLIQRLLAKNVADRPASALAVAKAIEAIESAPVSSQMLLPVGDERAAADGEEVTKRMKRTSVVAAPPRRRGLLVSAALIGLLVAAAAVGIVIRLRTPDGKEINIEAPSGTTVTIAAKDEDPKPPPPPVVPVVSPLDRLDPKDIPAADRFDWQPKDLVAVLGEHRLRHLSGNATVVFSPDGKMVASFSAEFRADRELCLWDAASGEKLLGLTHLAGFVSCAFQPGGRRLAALAYDEWGAPKHLLEWETTTGERLSLHKLDTPATALAYLPNDILVLGCTDGSVRVLNAQTKKETRVLRGHKAAITWLAVDVSVQFLATSSGDNITKVWDLAKGEERFSLKHQDIGMTPQAISHGGDILAGRSKEGVALWRLDKKQRQVVYTRPEGFPEGERVAFDHQSRQLAIGDLHGQVRLILVPENKDSPVLPPSIAFQALEGAIWSLNFSPDGRSLAVGGHTGVVRLWKVATEAKILGTHTAPVRSLVAIPNTQTVVSAAPDGTVIFWDTAACKAIRTLKADVHCLARAPDGKTIAAGSGDGRVRMWDVAEGKEREPLAKHRLAVLAVDYAPDGKTVVSGSADGAVVVWSVSEGKERFKLAGQGTGVSSLAYAPDGKTFAVGRADGRITIHEANTGKERRSLKDQGSPVLLAWSPDSRTLISCAKEKWGIRVWEVETGKQRFLLGEWGPVHSLAIAPNGARFATGMEDGAVLFWEWTAYQRPVIWHSGWSSQKPVTALAFSADGRRIIGGSANAHVFVGAADLGEENVPARGHTAPVNLLAFSPDGRTLTTASTRDRSARVWDVVGGKETHVFRNVWAPLAPKALSRDGRIVAWGAAEHPDGDPSWVPAILHDLQTGNAPSLQPSGTAPLYVVHTPDGRTLAQVGIDLWDGEAGKKLDRFYKAAVVPDDPQATQKDPTLQFVAGTGHIRGVQLSPDGRLLAVVSAKGDAKVWDVRAAKELWAVKGHEHDYPMFTPDGQTLAIYNGTTKRMKLYKADSGAEQQTVPLENFLWALAFAPDGKRVAWSGSNRVIVGELPSGRKLHEWTTATQVMGLAFAPDGRHLALGNNNGTVYILRLEAAKTGP
jgi:WD40 repeat protein/predicted Ser/Thr protein kinase